VILGRCGWAGALQALPETPVLSKQYDNPGDQSQGNGRPDHDENPDIDFLVGDPEQPCPILKQVNAPLEGRVDPFSVAVSQWLPHQFSRGSGNGLYQARGLSMKAVNLMGSALAYESPLWGSVGVDSLLLVAAYSYVLVLLHHDIATERA